MQAPNRAPDLEVSVRARRLSCVLDPSLMLSDPSALLLARQLSTCVDLWICPALWRLLDASEFFSRSPQRLSRWLGLPRQHPAERVGLALDLWSRWRDSRDLGGLGLYWVGLHQTESMLTEHVERGLPARFERLLAAWYTPDDGLGSGAGDEESASRGRDGALECAALSVALQGAPVLTLSNVEAGGPPSLLACWAEAGLSGTSWCDLESRAAGARPALAEAERQRWWRVVIDAGAAATLATGLRLSLVHVVAPHAQLLSGAADAADDAWADQRFGDGWSSACAEPPDDDAVAAPAGPSRAWWREAQALWMDL